MIHSAPHHLRGGFTLVELIVVIGLFVLISTFFLRGLQWVRHGASTNEKGMLLARFKNASVLLGRELSCAAAFLYPNRVTQESHPILVFKNAGNEVVAVFLAPSGLVMYNYNTDVVKPLFPLTTAFHARLIQENLIEYEVMFQKDQAKFSFRNRLTPLNSLP